MVNDTGAGEISTAVFTSIDYVQLTVYPLILLFGSVGNVLAILVVWSKKHRRKINDYFILNLAISDLCMLVISISADFYLKFREFPVGDLFCKGIWPLMTMCLFASVFTLTCMALERWRTIVKPLSTRLTTTQVLWLLPLTWVAGLACVSPLAVVAHQKGRTCTEDWPNFAMRQVYTAAIVLLQYALPLVIISIAYARIGLFLKNRPKFKAAEMGPNRQADARRKRTAENSKINKNLRTVVILFAIFMLPKQVLWLWLDFGDGENFKYFYDALTFCEFMLYIHSSTNPVVYGTILNDYRSGFRRYLGRICPCCQSHRMYGARVHPDHYAGHDYTQGQSNSLSTMDQRNNETRKNMHNSLHKSD